MIATLINEMKSVIDKKSFCIVGIDGGGGSGKSTLAQFLCDVIGEGQIVHLDDFYQVSLNRDSNHFNIGGEYDLNRLKLQVLQPLLQKRIANYQRYDWGLDALVENHQVSPHGLVVIEGCYSLCEELKYPYDVSVYIVTNHALRLKRGLERDGENAREFWEKWMRAEDYYVETEQPFEKATYILRGEIPYELQGGK